MIVFVLRHADRKPEPEDALSDKGIERAKLLARMLAESGIRTAFCSDALRAQATLQPLKQLLGAKLTVEVVPITEAGGTGGHVRQIVDAVKELPGDATVAIVCHTNTIEPLVRMLLKNQGIDPVAANEFDKLFVLSIPPTDEPVLTRLRYGAATP